MSRILPAYYVALTILILLGNLWRIPDARADILLHYTFLCVLEPTGRSGRQTQKKPDASVRLSTVNESSPTTGPIDHQLRDGYIPVTAIT